MISDIREIKASRKALELTQSALAKRAGVSQSLIAKVEAGTLDPTFSNAMKIFTALNTLSVKKELHAEQIMSGTIISASPKEPIQDAIAAMKKHGISQMPVIQDHKAVGMISEAGVLNPPLY